MQENPITTYTYEEVYNAALNYFNGNELQAKVWTDKYALRDKEGRFHELDPTDMHYRLAREFARIEEKYPNPLSEDEIYGYLKNFAKIVPQGSPMFGVGNEFQLVSTSNCAVLPSPEDTMSGILNTGRDLANLYKRRFGAGVDISTLRPEGASVNNAAITSTGAWSFADLYSYITRMVGQCIAEDQRVLTRRGLIPIKDVRAGSDEVWTRIGWVPVSNVFHNGKKAVYKLTTEHGYTIKATEDHIFSSGTGEKRMRDIGVGGDINILLGAPEWERDYVPLDKGEEYVRHEYNNSNRLNEDITLPTHLTPDLAYVLGFSYGNGSIIRDRKGRVSGISLAVAHNYPEVEHKLGEIIRRIFSHSPPTQTGDGAVNITYLQSRIVGEWLAANNLLKQSAGTITYPEAVRNSPIDVQLAFIAGFFDADGYASGRKKGFAFSSISKDFLTEIQVVLATVGIVSKLHEEDRSQQGWNTLYTLTVTGKVSKERFADLVGESIKANSLTCLGKRDHTVTPRTAQDLGVKPHKFSYVPGSPHTLSLNAVTRLQEEGESTATLIPQGILVQSTVTEIEYVGEVDTYDLELPEEHLFWCEGFYVHNSSRRGALLISLDVRHPDVEKFITMKQDLTKVTGANVSVRVTDDFMEAVEKDEEFTLRWPIEAPPEEAQFTKTVRAKNVFKLIAECAVNTGEPGFLFWDTAQKNLPLNNYPGFEATTTNPCGEVVLSPYDSCRLISIYLPNFVRHEFEEAAEFDWDDFEDTIRVAMRLSDDLVDLELEKLHAIRDAADTEDERDLFTNFIRSCEQGRRTGLGTHGLGDMLARHRLRYDSPEALDLVASVYECLRNTAYETSIELAKERGPFPIWDWEIEKDCEFFERFPAYLLDDMFRYGRRNGAILTLAPTGSVSILSENCSSGIEPVFLNEYNRKRKVNLQQYTGDKDKLYRDEVGDYWETYKVYHSNVQRYRDKYGLSENDPLPDYFVTASEIDWDARVDIQSLIQRNIDHSISSTTNLPSHANAEDVERIYMRAWKKGLKGITVYRDGSRDAQVLSAADSEAESVDEESDTPHSDTIYRGTETYGTNFKAEFRNLAGKERKVYVGVFKNAYGQPAEVFITDENGGKEVHAYAAALGKVLSIALKYNVSAEDLADTLEGIEGGSISYTGGIHKSVPDLVAKRLRQAVQGNIAIPNDAPLPTLDLDPIPNGVVTEETTTVGDECPSCGEWSYVRMESCPTCLNCGFTNCS